MKSFFKVKDVNPKEFEDIIKNKAKKEDFTLCDDLQKNVPIYHSKKIFSAKNKEDYKNELNYIFEKGPGVVVFKQMYEDLSLIDKKNEIFYEIHKEDKELYPEFSHFTGPNPNLRIWNTLEKAALKNSECFINYYKNPIIRLVSESWLGSFYQVTSQVNSVKPNGKAQSPHRDYHLGFQEDYTVEKFPLNAQVMSQMLTLQGAIAHSDMPIESGPTMLLPFSQQYPLGYLAYREKTFQDIFHENYIQLPLEKGDGVFFNPALFHGSGNNHSNSDRIANLLQISSAFGKPMETLNFEKMTMSLYQPLLEKFINKQIDREELENVCLCICDNYSFPTNIAKDVPSQKTNTPQSTFELTYESILEKVPYETFKEKLKQKYEKRS